MLASMVKRQEKEMEGAMAGATMVAATSIVHGAGVLRHAETPPPSSVPRRLAEVPVLSGAAAQTHMGQAAGAAASQPAGHGPLCMARRISCSPSMLLLRPLIQAR
jgi:hypothetical protein